MLVTPSPEPVSNIGLSSAEDVVAIGLTWLATHHPIAAATGVAAVCLILPLMLRWSITRIRAALGARRFGSTTSGVLAAKSGQTRT